MTVTHQKSRTREYKIWCGIKTRCYNIYNSHYIYYGNRGIVMSDEWKNNFEQFLEDMGERPSPEHTIERDDVNGNYCKSNCRWVHKSEQSKNRRCTYYVVYNGERKQLSVFCNELGLDYYLMKGRIIDCKWDINIAFKTPARQKKEGINNYERFKL